MDITFKVIHMALELSLKKEFEYAVYKNNLTHFLSAVENVKLVFRHCFIDELIEQENELTDLNLYCKKMKNYYSEFQLIDKEKLLLHLREMMEDYSKLLENLNRLIKKMKKNKNIDLINSLINNIKFISDMLKTQYSDIKK